MAVPSTLAQHARHESRQYGVISERIRRNGHTQARVSAQGVLPFLSFSAGNSVGIVQLWTRGGPARSSGPPSTFQWQRQPHRPIRGPEQHSNVSSGAFTCADSVCNIFRRFTPNCCKGGMLAMCSVDTTCLEPNIFDQILVPEEYAETLDKPVRFSRIT